MREHLGYALNAKFTSISSGTPGRVRIHTYAYLFGADSCVTCTGMYIVVKAMGMYSMSNTRRQLLRANLGLRLENTNMSHHSKNMPKE